MHLFYYFYPRHEPAPNTNLPPHRSTFCFSLFHFIQTDIPFRKLLGPPSFISIKKSVHILMEVEQDPSEVFRRRFGAH